MSRKDTRNHMSYNTEKGGLADPAAAEDSGFFERFAEFAFGQLPENRILDERTLYLSRLAVVTAAGAGETEEFILLIPSALQAGLAPEEIREIAFQGEAYLGIGRIRPILRRIAETFRSLNITVSENTPADRSTEQRREAGTAAQIELFGEAVRDFYTRSRINYYVVTHCFGDHYARKILSVKERALVTFCFLYTMGGVDHELGGYIRGNLHVGNTPEILADVIYQNIPWAGFPRSLNAMSVLNEVTEQKN